MSPRAAARLAWSLWAAGIAAIVCAHALALAYRPEVPLYDYWVEATIGGPVFGTVGALIASRRPGNTIGWIFLLPGVAGGLQIAAGQYATVAFSPGGRPLPGAAFAAWSTNLLQFAFVLSVLFLILFFPTGRLPSPRWRIVVWAAASIFAASMLSFALMPGPLDNFPSQPNPFGIAGAEEAFDSILAVGGPAAIACFVAAVVSLMVRFRRSTGKVRQQLKWFVYAATLGFAAILFGNVLVPASFDPVFGTLVWTVAPLSLPISAGIAILKYRLYDIDLLINRTLVYGSLTATLVLMYLMTVVSLQYALRALTGQNSTLAIVASTLVIAALFGPLRERIQRLIDRSFYRRKYDAKKTLDEFSSKLRDETDLERLTGEVEAVIAETLQPAHLSLWLRELGEVSRAGDAR